MNASDTKQAPRPLSRGEARIRRAFILSLVLIVSLAVAGIILYWLRHPPAEEQPVGEARVDAPSLPAPVPTPDQPPRGGVHDITESAGIGLVHVIGAYRERLMAETIGSGVAFIAYDRDGDQDLLLVNSRYWEGHEVEGATHTQALYANDGQGRFTDLTQKAGLALTFYGMGVAVGDYDGDLFPFPYPLTLR